MITTRTHALRVTVILALFGALLLTQVTYAQSLDIFIDTSQMFGKSVYQTALGDLDSDGDLDLVTAHFSLAGQWYRNNGNGSFNYVGYIGSSDNGSNYVFIEDFNGDDIPDIMVGGYTRIWIRVNDGSGNFESPITLSVPFHSAAAHPGDFDGDGDVDIMVTGNCCRIVSPWDPGGVLYVNDGSANFTPIAKPEFYATTEDSVAVADIDGDGDLDISQEHILLLNDGNGNFTPTTHPFDPNYHGNRSFGDVDGDNDLDLIIGSYNGFSRLYLNNGSGGFSETDQLLNGWGESTFADINLDGSLDVVVQGSSSFIYLNDGNGTFDLYQSVPGFISHQASLGDINGDLYPDLIQSRGDYYEGGARIFLNNHPFNKPPQAVVGGPYAIDEGGEISLDGSGSSDPDNDPLIYLWDFGDGSTLEGGETQNYIYYVDGTYFVTLCVEDTHGFTDCDNTEVVVSNAPPEVTIINPVFGALHEVNTSVNLVADFTDPSANDEITCSINWGLGTTLGDVTQSVEPVIGTCSATNTYSTPGVYPIEVIVNDGDDGQASDNTLVVVYDPSGGFVTGGGWITSPEGAMNLPGPVVVWDQDFSTDTFGWFGDGIAANYGIAELLLPGGQYSRFDGYRDVWPGTYTAEIDVYLDPTWPADQGFDYSVASNGTDGSHQRDFIFHVGTVENYGPISGKELLIAVDNNSYGDTNPFVLTTRPGGYFIVPTAGWYTLQHVFYDAGGYLAIDLNVIDANGNILWSDTTSDISDSIPGEVGGNRYSWFVHIDVSSGIQVDNHKLILSKIPSPEEKATFGFVSKYKKGADVPTGNTEFQFKAGNLNFQSTSYDWLVVTGSDYAKFKGSGTINGEGEYNFQIWAGDSDSDTFRIKIWKEEDENEVVVYDNGMNQAIGGGSIVIHTK